MKPRTNCCPLGNGRFRPRAIPLADPMPAEDAPMALPVAEAVESRNRSGRRRRSLARSASRRTSARIPIVSIADTIFLQPNCPPASASPAAGRPAARIASRSGPKSSERRGVERFRGVDRAPNRRRPSGSFASGCRPPAVAEPIVDSPPEPMDESVFADEEILARLRRLLGDRFDQHCDSASAAGLAEHRLGKGRIARAGPSRFAASRRLLRGRRL